MKLLFFISIFFLLFFSCKKNVSQSKQPLISKPVVSNSFEIKGTLENFYPKTIYLNKIIENTIYQIDSSEVLNNKFTFKGIVEFPERFSLTFQDYSSMSVFIIENTQMNLIIRSDKINEPIITGSDANALLDKYKVASKKIFKKIDYLFPRFQKARLENDAKELEKVEVEMKKIEKEFTNFSFSFIIQNKDSYVSPMILRDQLKSTTIDTLRIKETFKILSKKVKNSPDSQIIGLFLNLH